MEVKRRKNFMGVRLTEEEEKMKSAIIFKHGQGYVSNVMRSKLREEFKRLEKEKIIK